MPRCSPCFSAIALRFGWREAGPRRRRQSAHNTQSDEPSHAGAGCRHPGAISSFFRLKQQGVAPIRKRTHSPPTASATPRRFGVATMGSMALVVFFRGINVGGHRAFRPSVLAKELGIYDAVNVGAAGTLVIRKPGLRAKFLVELRRKLPFEATIAFCDGSDLIRLEMDNPFGSEPPPADVVQFVSILSEAGRRRVSLPIALPEGGEWLVRIIWSEKPS